MERVTHEMRRRKWAAIIKECNESGKKKKVWLAEHNINPKAFYKWQKRLSCLFQKITAYHSDTIERSNFYGISHFQEI